MHAQAMRRLEEHDAAAALAKEHEVVLTHGNGPQVGEILLRSDLTADKFPTITIDNAVAATQGQIGIMLQHALADALQRPPARRNRSCSLGWAATIIQAVVVISSAASSRA